MGKGQRHSKNAGVMGAEGLSYHEKKALGYGTVKERLGKESQGNFDDCCLTLQSAQDPVITPHGFLFSKEAILENLLAQKKALKNKLAAWEAQQTEEQKQTAEKEEVEQAAQLIAFDRQNHMGISEKTADTIKATMQEEAAHMHEAKGAKAVIAIQDNRDRMKDMKAFWLPQATPQAKAVLQKPDLHTTCPASGKKLRLKDLIPVRFTPVPKGEPGKYMDPVTRQTLTNASKVVVLKKTGDVMLEETYNKCVKPEGNYDGVTVKEADVIRLQTGGTGFAARDKEKAVAKKEFTLGPGSGLADLRGQHQGPRSHGGLVFYN